MKESLTDYATALSGDYSVLEDIIDKKYLKFKKFFDLMRDYTKDIKQLEYVFDKKDVLRVKVAFKKKVSFDNKLSLIEEWKDSGYDVEYLIDGKEMEVKITYNE